MTAHWLSFDDPVDPGDSDLDPDPGDSGGPAPADTGLHPVGV